MRDARIGPGQNLLKYTLEKHCMTPAAPTATWRRVCEDHFSRLIEDLEQQVESEVESRVTVATEAAIRGAVADATGESRRALAEELNQAVRRLRQSDNVDDLYGTLLDVTLIFCDQAAIFSINQSVAHAECMRRLTSVASGEDRGATSLPALEFSITEAAAFSTAVETRDPVIAMSAASEVSDALVRLFEHKADDRVYLFPLVANECVTSVFYASGNVQAPSLELLSEVAGLRLQNLTAAVPEPAAPVAQPPAQALVTISGTGNQPSAGDEPTASKEEKSSEPRNAWWDLSRQDQQLHLAAQRFARVQVAEMRLTNPDAVRSGRTARNLYLALQPQIDAAREKFGEKHITLSPSMVDYLHLELVRSLADDDPSLLGSDYPGPLA
jgi:hypothetical protein